MTFAGVAALVGFVLVATITPGGATTLVAASGARFGFVRSVPLMVGICVGMASLVGAVGLGLGAVLSSSAALELILRVVGTVYLAALAARIARQGAPEAGSTATSRPLTSLQGIGVAWVNPKVWTLAAAGVAAHADLAESEAAVATAFAVAFLLVGLLSAAVWCWLGSQAARHVGSVEQWRHLNRGLALLLILSAVPIWL